MLSASKRSLLLVLTLLLALPVYGVVGAAPAADGPNLLQNPGFESPYNKQCCQTDLSVYQPNTPIDEVQVAAGWLAWWLPPDIDSAHPSTCNTPGCVAWHRPEWREANCGDVCANRVRSGGNAQKYFTFYSVHDAGMYQQVHGVAPGSRLRFSAYMQAWSTHENFGPSSGQSSMGMRVGVDPYGGTNPFDPRVVWSAPFDSYDTWALYSVEATARNSTVTVFTRSAPVFPLQHNDIYIDDASLVVVSGGSGGSGTGGSSQPTTVAPTPSPVSGFVYIVVPGDNFYRIARKFGVSVQSILAANPTANPNILRVGTRLVIPGVSGPVGGGTSGSGTSPAPTQSPAEIPGAITYVVQRGDNLYRLARRFGTTVERIRELNNLTGSMIYIGQTLIIAP